MPNLVPDPYEADRQAIARKRALAQALQQQALQPQGTQQIGGIAIRNSPLAGITPLVQALMAKKGMGEADTADKALSGQIQQRSGADYSLLAQAMQGRQASPAGLSEDASGNVTPTDPIEAQTPAQALSRAIPMLQNPQLQQFGLQQIAANQPKKPEGFTLAPGATRYGPDGKPLITAPAKEPESWSEPYQLGGAMVQKNSKTGEIRTAVTRPPVTNVNASPNINLGREDDEYLKGRRKQQAEAFGVLEKGAESAYKQIQTIDRFIEASKKGTAGGAQPVISGVQNFLSSFGYSPEQLKDVRVMEQAIGDILGNKMSELGARGLTDKDMEILRQALPRVSIDRGSRETVAGILRKSHEFSLEQYEAARAEEDRIYPDFSKKTPVQGWLKDYRAKKAKPPAPPETETPVKPPAVVNWSDLGR